MVPGPLERLDGRVVCAGLENMTDLPWIVPGGERTPRRRLARRDRIAAG